MTRTIYICTNRKQLFGARIAKYAMETRGRARECGIPVHLIKVEEVAAFQAFVGTPYRPGYGPYTFDDLQSFTLTRFMPPERMGFEGRAFVIDPDIFAVSNISELFALDLDENAIAACKKNNYWDASAMLLECSKLTHWKIDDLLEQLAEPRLDYKTLMELQKEQVVELDRKWNRLDKLNPDTRLLHTTNRLTQPWKTGLPIDFTFNPMPKFFGIIPREPIHKLLGKTPTHYQQHPDPAIERFFFTLAHEALSAGAIEKSAIAKEIKQKHIRPDFFEKMEECI